MFYFFGGGASPSASPMAVQLSGQAPVVPQTSSPPKASPSTAAPSPPLIKPTQAQGAKSRRRRSSKGPDQQQSERAEHAKEIEEVVWIEDDDETAGAPGQEAGPCSAQQQQREVAVVAAGRDGSEPVVVRIHFGMSGAFKVSTSLPGPEPTSTTRLSLTNRGCGGPCRRARSLWAWH
ncbi:hypothetical protein DUNSADRAFT_18594 [Dunaliella salina]|uniref:Encoded protein n=1 Tax=Dunaliella salina TaxID=3046 RepID=A0ABQ7FZU6_DUNSA|nr:hypothetical protein DUNSADRAFT_18594 [Dunaliella salina]|eukprot:KAF5827876.1 hypothetical protein DUNSADRAFT_18594 [Dunaliella salina]